MGFLFVFLASFIFGSVPTIQDYVIREGASPLGLVVICNTAAAAAALIAGMIRKESLRIRSRYFFSLALTGGVGLFLTDWLLNIAYTRIPVGLTTMIHFLYPTIVSLSMIVFFREKTNTIKLGAMVVSFLGLFLLFGGNMKGNFSGMLAAAASAFCYSFYIISNDRLPPTEIPDMVRAFYINSSSVAAALAVGSFTGGIVLPSTGVSVLLSILVGVLLCTALVLLNLGIQRLGASKAAFFNMFEPITSLTVSSIVLHSVPTWITILGSCLVLLSLTLYAYADRKQTQG